MPYFQISHGLRGCYMPSDTYVIKADTRRALREAIAYEAENYREGGFIGASERAISAIAAAAWRDRAKFQLPYALPLAPPHARTNYCFGVFVSSATRAEYLEHLESCD